MPLIGQTVQKGRIQPGEIESWNGVLVSVPAVPPTGLGGDCSIMEVGYRQVQ